MRGDVYKKLLEREMTRKEFLQISGSLLFALFGFANLVALLKHFAKPGELTKQANLAETRHGFGSRKFGA